LVFVHAHPDDEALSTGGTIARYADEGAQVCLVTCTNGELGEIAEVPELGSLEQIRDRLGEVRASELEEACRILGEVDVRMLGYHDSGMDGTESNKDPKVFMNQDLDEAAEKIAAVVREVRPQVVVTYNDYGFYGHPDHIRAHEATLRALDLAADTHEVSKLYYTAFPKSLMQAAREVDLGDDSERFTEEEIERISTDDALVTAAIDVSAYLDKKFKALEAHRTQRGTTEWVLNMPAEYRALAFGTEYYVLAKGKRTNERGWESDLF
jgi:N-acetyl-1-D-myo-inositol-2-amino-2-deoxy-alpha-D-glucopyranoside deacetylase